MVWGESEPRPGLHNKLKDVDAKLDVPPLREELRRFVDWVADYTLGAKGTVLGMALRMGAQGPAREKIGVRLAGPAPQRMTAARARVLKVLAEDGMARTKSDLAQEAGVSAGVIDGLIDEGTLETLVLPPEPVALSA